MSTVFRESHQLATASRYANPRDASAILPIVYGINWGVRGTGRWICPCIDTVNKYFMLADHAILSVTTGNVIQVYVDGVLQTTGYTITTSGADENGATISYLTFTTLPAEGTVVSASGSGKVDGSALLIQNPLDIIADIVTHAGGSSADFDAVAWQRERQYCAAQHIYAAGVLTHGALLVQELIIEILSSFLATSFLTPDDMLIIQFPRYDFPQAEVQAFVHESECLSINGEREDVINAALWDVNPDAVHGNVLYPNLTAATVDCFPGVGATGTVVFLSDICCLSYDSNTTTCYAWYLNAARTAVTATSYLSDGNWIPVEYTQLDSGARKRLFWRNTSTSNASIWTLNANYTYASSVSKTESGYMPYGYWHNGTEGRIVWCDASGNYKLWTINASDAYVSQITATASGYTALSYQRSGSGRRRLSWLNNTTKAFHLWRLSSSDAYASGVTLAAIAGYTPQHYWHNGLFGRITYTKDGGGTSIYRYVDANDAVTEWLPVAAQADYPYARNSQAKYGEQIRQFPGGWLQDVTTPIPIQRALYAQYGDVPWILTIGTAQQDVFQLERGDLVCWSWERLRDENSLPLVNQMGRILEISRQPLTNTCRLKVMGLRSYYTASGVRDRNRY